VHTVLDYRFKSIGDMVCIDIIKFFVAGNKICPSIDIQEARHIMLEYRNCLHMTLNDYANSFSSQKRPNNNV
jgi:hypothetical protein